MNTTILTTHDQQPLLVRRWGCVQARATIQILHGMSEHCERYHEFARFLNKQGFEVIAHNHRGHGERTPLGHFANDNGWELVLDDVSVAQQLAAPNIPLVLFGHSMGSFIARAWAARHGEKIRALILSGSNYQPPILFKTGQALAKTLSAFQSERHLSRIMNVVSFGEFNKPFKPARTDFDWLSRDPAVVDAYIADPLCGQLASLGMWSDLLGGLITIMNTNSLKQLPLELPILSFGGDKDPVGRAGKGLYALDKALKKTGHANVTTMLYPNGRHEMLNEINKEQVFNDIATWLTQRA